MTAFNLSLSRPVFLVGFPRSGTTYLQSLLATQAEIVSFPETHFYSVLTGHMDCTHGLDQDQMLDLVERASRYQLLSEQEQNMLSQQKAENGLVTRKKCYQSLLAILISRQNEKLIKGQYFLDKTPSHCLSMDDILVDHPEASFIYLLRHPIDAISSYMLNLNMDDSDLSVVIEKWKNHFDSAENFIHAHPASVHTLKYESLILNKTAALEAILSFLGLDLNSERLADYAEIAKKFIMPYETWKKDNTAKKYQESKSQLTWKEKLEIEYQLKSRMAQCSYPLRNKTLLSLYEFKNGKAK